MYKVFSKVIRNLKTENFAYQSLYPDCVPSVTEMMSNFFWGE